MHTCLGAAGKEGAWGMWDLQARPCRLCRSLTMDPQGPDFRAVPQGHWPRPPELPGQGPARAAIPTCWGRGHLGQWLPHPRQALGMNYFSTFTQEQTGSDKTLLDEGRTGINKAWKILFPQITGGVRGHTESGRKAGGGPGVS